MNESKAVTITKHLPVKIDQYRERALNTQMVDGRMEEIRVTDHLANVSASLKATIKDSQKKQTDAARALHAGFEMCPVSCEQKLEGQHMVTYRLDTGEKIDERALTVEERKATR